MSLFTFLMFVYTFSLYMLFCVLQELQGRCFIQFLYYPGLSQQFSYLESAACSELYSSDIPLCGWLGSKHQLTNSKLSESDMLQTAKNQGAWPSQWSWGNKTKKKKKGLTMGFEQSTAHVFGLHKMRRVWRAVSVHRCQLASHWSVRGWWQVSWISLRWPSSVYPHTFCVLYQRGTTAW